MTIFERIVAGEIPSYKIAEDDNYLAFLDAFPLRRGHCLVIPKKATDYIFDIGDQEFIGLQLFSKKVARAMDQVLDCERIGVAVIGLEVPHAHIHLVPINGVADIDFSQPKLQISGDEMEKVASQIRAAL
ncbi:MAG: HIT family protein [Bacteroidia bacterium]